EDVVVELELRRQAAPLEELPVAEVRRQAAPGTGHRLEPDQRLPDGEQVVPAVVAGGDDRGRRPLADPDVAAVEQRVVDQTGLDVVVLDAVVPDVGQPGAPDGERARDRPDAVAHVVDADVLDRQVGVLEPEARVVQRVYLIPREAPVVLPELHAARDADHAAAPQVDRIEVGQRGEERGLPGVEPREVEQRAVVVGRRPRSGERDQRAGSIEAARYRRGRGGGRRGGGGGCRRRGRARRGRGRRGAGRRRLSGRGGRHGGRGRRQGRGRLDRGGRGRGRGAGARGRRGLVKSEGVPVPAWHCEGHARVRNPRQGDDEGNCAEAFRVSHNGRSSAAPRIQARPFSDGVIQYACPAAPARA